MSDIESLSSTAASNNAASPNGAPEGMAPSGVNDTMREMMGAMHRDWERKGPTLTSGGGANAQTLTYGAAPTAYVQGQSFSFIAGFTNTGAMTLNVNGLGARSVFLGGVAMTGGEIQGGKVYTVMYDGTQFALTSNPGLGRGLLIGIQYFTTPGTSTYTPTAGTNFVVAEVLGAGGGGGGCASTGAAQVAGGQSGGGGGYARKRITNSFSGVTVTVGAKGNGGTAGANAGTNGGTSSFGALVSATGGTGGTGGTAIAVPAAAGGANGGSGSSGDINISGSAGVGTINTVTNAVMNGAGGDSIYGKGAPGIFIGLSGTAGNNASGGYGQGGSAGTNAASQGTGKAGGNGTDGLVMVWEYA